MTLFCVLICVGILTIQCGHGSCEQENSKSVSDVVFEELRNAKIQDVKNIEEFIRTISSSDLAALSSTLRNRQKRALSSDHTSDQLELHLNSIFRDVPRLNYDFVNHIVNSGADIGSFINLTPEEFFKLNNNPIMRDFIKKFIVIQVREVLWNYNRQEYEKNIAKLNNPDVLDEIDVTKMFNPSIMLTFLHRKLAQIKLKEHLDYHFPDNQELNSEFVNFVVNSGADIESFIMQPQKFYKLNNNQTMRNFTNKFNVNQVRKVLRNYDQQECEKNLAKLNNPEVLDKIDVKMMFNPSSMWNFLHRKLAQIKLKEHLDYHFQDNPELNSDFVSHVAWSNGDLRSYGKKPEEFYNLKDAIMQNFVKKYKMKQVKRVLKNYNQPGYQEKSTKLNSSRALDNINVEMMFNPSIMKMFLDSKWAQITLQDHLDSIFPNAHELNSKFVHFVLLSKGDIRLFTKQPEEFYKMNKDPIMQNFTNKFKKSQVEKVLKIIKPNGFQDDWTFMEKEGSMKNVDIEMMFNPEKMKEFIKDQYKLQCKSKFKDALSKKSYNADMEWGRTPDKCITDPICNSTEKFWKNREILPILEKFEAVPRTFDEVDDNFFDLIKDDIKSGENNFNGDVDCLIAFIKRTNGKENWYKYELQFKDSERRTKLAEIIEIARYNKSEFETSSPSEIETANNLEEIHNQCGKTNGIEPGVGFVRNGEKAVRGQFPWLIAYFHQTSVKLMFICGASLVSKKVVVTSAHCMLEKQKSDFEQRKPEDATFFAGKHDINKMNEAYNQMRQASQFIIHPDWDASVDDYDSDIAIAILTRALTFNKFIYPICIWKETSSYEDMIGTNGEVAGWGVVEDSGITSDTPMFAKLTVVKNLNCHRSNEDLKQLSSEKTFCAGMRDSDIGPCRGDSGGAFVFRHNDLI